MKIIKQNIKCPECRGPLKTRVIACDRCNLRLEGDFSENEFGSLNDDELYFLRIFIHCEGKIQDMEKALGVSYPTVKARISELKRFFMLDFEENEKPKEMINEAEPYEKPEQILAGLDEGSITYEEALKRIKKYKDGK